jgi:glycosyltransferase involved in cell wall biosynthesis
MLLANLVRFFQVLSHQGIRQAFARACRRIFGTAQRKESGALRAEMATTMGKVAACADRVTANAEQIQEICKRQAASIVWLAEQQVRASSLGVAADRPSFTSLPRPWVSVIMPVWNRAHCVAEAIDSVLVQTYPNWELIVVDDGSTDRTVEALSPYLTDARIHLVRQDHAGQCSARNRGLTASTGDIIAYLDSDNRWYPGYLQAMVEVLKTHPDRDSAHAACLFVNAGSGLAHIVHGPHDPKRQLNAEENIDLNVFAHRHELVQRYGGFDERLTRFVDCDLILRYAQASPPVQVPVLGCRYRCGAADQVSSRENVGHNLYLIRRKHEEPIRRPLRVLYALHQYPQLSETYVQAEMDYMRRRGVHIEVWAHDEPLVPYESPVPVHRGSLRAAIERVQPDVVHSHWICAAAEYANEVDRAGLPLTVRAHSFEFSPEAVAELDRHPAVRAIFMFPHYLPHCSSGLTKLRALNVAFNPDLHFPAATKDRGLVFRTGLTKLSKNLACFLRVAQRCPNHRFVLAITPGGGNANMVKEILAHNRLLRCPVDIRLQLGHAETAALSRRAGIYLHTYSDMEPYGMPISIAEAMASGSYILGWHCPPAAAYIGAAGATYSTEEEAADLIRATETWTDDKWRRAELRSIDRAFTHFADMTVLQPMLDEWSTIAAEGRCLQAAA